MERTSFWTQAILSLSLLGLAGLGWHFRADLMSVWASGTAGQPENRAPAAESGGPPVIVAEVRSTQDDLTFSAIGTGFALRSVTLRAPSAGAVTELAIAPGRKFSAGDTLMQLDDTDQRLAVALAEARLERATSVRDRYRSLQDTGTAATARLEEAQTAFKVAQIELEQARADLDDRTLRAPFDGVSGLATVEAGDRVSADEAISSFDDRTRILVEFDLPEGLLGRVRTGLGITAETPAVEGQSFEGEISEIDSRVESGTRTARVRAAIENEGDLLRPGLSFALHLELPGATYPAVPELALQFSRGSLFVWRVTDKTAEQVPVRLVRRRAGQVILDGPLAEEDRVVVEGTQRLRPGVEVNVLNAPGEGRS